MQDERSPLSPEDRERIQEQAGKSCALQAYGDRESWFCAADEFEDALATALAERDRYRKALEKIAGCERRVEGDVVDVAREALNGGAE